MPVLRVRVIAEVDNVALPGFPLERRMTLTEGETLDYQKIADANATTFTAVPGDAEGVPGTLQALILRTDALVNLRLNAQSDAGIALNAGGLFVLLDAVIGSALGTKVKVNNPAQSGNATIKAYLAGNV